MERRKIRNRKKHPSLLQAMASRISGMLPPGVEGMSIISFTCLLKTNHTKATILAKREAAIARIPTLIYGYFNKLRSIMSSEDDPDLESVCANSRRDCLLLQIGSIFCELDSLDLWPAKSAGDVRVSPIQLQKSLMHIRLSDCQHNSIGKSRKKSVAGGSPQSTCGSFGSILQQINNMTSEKSGITEAQANYMATQRRKWEHG